MSAPTLTEKLLPVARQLRCVTVFTRLHGLDVGLLLSLTSFGKGGPGGPGAGGPGRGSAGPAATGAGNAAARLSITAGELLAAIGQLPDFHAHALPGVASTDPGPGDGVSTADGQLFDTWPMSVSLAGLAVSMTPSQRQARIGTGRASRLASAPRGSLPVLLPLNLTVKAEPRLARVCPSCPVDQSHPARLPRARAGSSSADRGNPFAGGRAPDGGSFGDRGNPFGGPAPSARSNPFDGGPATRTPARGNPFASGEPAGARGNPFASPARDPRTPVLADVACICQSAAGRPPVALCRVDVRAELGVVVVSGRGLDAALTAVADELLPLLAPRCIAIWAARGAVAAAGEDSTPFLIGSASPVLGGPGSMVAAASSVPLTMRQRRLLHRQSRAFHRSGLDFQHGMLLESRVDVRLAGARFELALPGALLPGVADPPEHLPTSFPFAQVDPVQVTAVLSLGKPASWDAPAHFDCEMDLSLPGETALRVDPAVSRFLLQLAAAGQALALQAHPIVRLLSQASPATGRADAGAGSAAAGGSAGGSAASPGSSPASGSASSGPAGGAGASAHPLSLMSRIRPGHFAVRAVIGPVVAILSPSALPAPGAPAPGDCPPLAQLSLAAMRVRLFLSPDPALVESVETRAGLLDLGGATGTAAAAAAASVPLGSLGLLPGATVAWRVSCAVSLEEAAVWQTLPCARPAGASSPGCRYDPAMQAWSCKRPGGGATGPGGIKASAWSQGRRDSVLSPLGVEAFLGGSVALSVPLLSRLYRDAGGADGPVAAAAGALPTPLCPDRCGHHHLFAATAPRLVSGDLVGTVSLAAASSTAAAGGSSSSELLTVAAAAAAAAAQDDPASGGSSPRLPGGPGSPGSPGRPGGLLLRVTPLLARVCALAFAAPAPVAGPGSAVAAAAVAPGSSSAGGRGVAGVAKADARAKHAAGAPASRHSFHHDPILGHDGEFSFYSALAEASAERQQAAQQAASTSAGPARGPLRRAGASAAGGPPRRSMSADSTVCTCAELASSNPFGGEVCAGCTGRRVSRASRPSFASSVSGQPPATTAGPHDPTSDSESECDSGDEHLAEGSDGGGGPRRSMSSPGVAAGAETSSSSSSSSPPAQVIDREDVLVPRLMIDPPQSTPLVDHQAGEDFPQQTPLPGVSLDLTLVLAPISIEITCPPTEAGAPVGADAQWLTFGLPGETSVRVSGSAPGRLALAAAVPAFCLLSATPAEGVWEEILAGLGVRLDAHARVDLWPPGSSPASRAPHFASMSLPPNFAQQDASAGDVAAAMAAASAPAPAPGLRLQQPAYFVESGRDAAHAVIPGISLGGGPLRLSQARIGMSVGSGPAAAGATTVRLSEAVMTKGMAAVAGWMASLAPTGSSPVPGPVATGPVAESASAEMQAASASAAAAATKAVDEFWLYNRTAADVFVQLPGCLASGSGHGPGSSAATGPNSTIHLLPFSDVLCQFVRPPSGSGWDPAALLEPVCFGFGGTGPGSGSDTAVSLPVRLLVVPPPADTPAGGYVRLEPRANPADGGGAGAGGLSRQGPAQQFSLLLDSSLPEGEDAPVAGPMAGAPPSATVMRWIIRASYLLENHGPDPVAVYPFETPVPGKAGPGSGTSADGRRRRASIDDGALLINGVDMRRIAYLDRWSRRPLHFPPALGASGGPARAWGPGGDPPGPVAPAGRRTSTAPATAAGLPPMMPTLRWIALRVLLPNMTDTWTAPVCVGSSTDVPGAPGHGASFADRLVLKIPGGRLLGLSVLHRGCLTHIQVHGFLRLPHPLSLWVAPSTSALDLLLADLALGRGVGGAAATPGTMVQVENTLLTGGVKVWQHLEAPAGMGAVPPVAFPATLVPPRHVRWYAWDAPHNVLSVAGAQAPGSGLRYVGGRRLLCIEVAGTRVLVDPRCPGRQVVLVALPLPSAAHLSFTVVPDNIGQGLRPGSSGPSSRRGSVASLSAGHGTSMAANPFDDAGPRTPPRASTRTGPSNPFAGGPGSSLIAPKAAAASTHTSLEATDAALRWSTHSATAAATLVASAAPPSTPTGHSSSPRPKAGTGPGKSRVPGPPAVRWVEVPVEVAVLRGGRVRIGLSPGGPLSAQATPGAAGATGSGEADPGGHAVELAFKLTLAPIRLSLALGTPGARAVGRHLIPSLPDEIMSTPASASSSGSMLRLSRRPAGPGAPPTVIGLSHGVFCRLDIGTMVVHLTLAPPLLAPSTAYGPLGLAQLPADPGLEAAAMAAATAAAAAAAAAAPGSAPAPRRGLSGVRAVDASSHSALSVSLTLQSLGVVHYANGVQFESVLEARAAAGPGTPWLRVAAMLDLPVTGLARVGGTPAGRASPADTGLLLAVPFASVSLAGPLVVRVEDALVSRSLLVFEPLFNFLADLSPAGPAADAGGPSGPGGPAAGPAVAPPPPELGHLYLRLGVLDISQVDVALSLALSSPGELPGGARARRQDPVRAGLAAATAWGALRVRDASLSMARQRFSQKSSTLREQARELPPGPRGAPPSAAPPGSAPADAALFAAAGGMRLVLSPLAGPPVGGSTADGGPPPGPAGTHGGPSALALVLPPGSDFGFAQRFWLEMVDTRASSADLVPALIRAYVPSLATQMATRIVPMALVRSIFGVFLG